MKKKTILHIPSKYPSVKDMQLGIFTQKNTELTSNYYNNIVLYIQGVRDRINVNVKVSKTNNVTLVHVTYSYNDGALSKLRNYLNSVTTGLSKVIEIGENIDFVHCHLAGKNLWIAQKYFHNIPCFLTEHWSGFLNGKFELLPKWKQKIRIKRINKCDKVFTISKQFKIKLEELGVKVPISILENESNFLNNKLENEIIEIYKYDKRYNKQ